MTPKEEAKELINSMYKAEDGLNKYPMCFDTAKQCALICVNKIIKSYPTTVETFNNYKGLNVIHIDNRKYWQEVKQEINNYETK